AMAVFLIAPAIFLSQALATPSPSVQRAILKQALLDSLRYDLDSFQPSKFEVDDTTIYYQFGGLKDRVGTIPREPYDVPLATQATVEAVRKYSWGPVGRAVWQDRLLAIEEIVVQELSVISQGNENQLNFLKVLEGYQRQTDELFLSAMREFGKRDNKRIA